MLPDLTYLNLNDLKPASLNDCAEMCVFYGHLDRSLGYTDQTLKPGMNIVLSADIDRFSVSKLQAPTSRTSSLQTAL